MHPSPPSGPNQPHGYGQQPQHPQQPQQPQHPQQGGYGYPQQPMPQGPGGHPYGAPGGPPPPPHFNGAPGNPDTMPGMALTVRILMFIGGPVGILLGLGLGVIFLGLAGGGAAMNNSSGAPDAELNAMLGVLGALGILIALIPLTYGIASTWLAAVMGRRKKGVYWGVVAFNIVALLLLVLNVISAIAMEGPPGALIPFAFHATMTGLMFAPKVRAFYGA